MARRGRRTPAELADVPMHDWTPAEYKSMDDEKTYTVFKAGARYIVTGKISASVVAGQDGEIKEGRHLA